MADTPGAPGEEVEFVALPDGRLLVEREASGADLTPLADALEGSIDPPYRAVAVRRDELWVVGGCTIEIAELTPDPGGDEIEVIGRDFDRTDVRIDGLPSLARVAALERLGEARSRSYVARARRLVGALFEVEVEAL